MVPVAPLHHHFEVITFLYNGQQLPRCVPSAMMRSPTFSSTLLLLAAACSGDVDPSDSFSGTGLTTGPPGENSALCAPVVEVEAETGDETGGEEPFPPAGQTAVLYACEGTVEVDFYGTLCTCGNGQKVGENPSGQCYYDIDLRPADEATSDQVGIPSPVVTSSTGPYPDVEVGACCLELGPDVDEQELANALDLVCLADCGARACEEVFVTLAAIRFNDACFFGDSFDPGACPLFLGEACVGMDHYKDCRPKPAPLATCGQAQLLGATRSDIDTLLALLQTPTGFQKCQDDIVDEAGWRPCVPSYGECENWAVDNGRFIDLTVKADCAVDPVLFDAFNAPEAPEEGCTANPNANPGTAVPGEGFSGPLTGGSLSLSTPLGEKNVGIRGSSIGFRRLPCDTSNCVVTLTDLGIDFEDFALGPLMITELRAKLVDPALVLVRDDMTAIIEDRAVYMQATFRVALQNSLLNKMLAVEKSLSVLVSNDGPVTMSVDMDNNIQIVEASFVLPSDIKGRLTTDSASCAPEW